MSEIQTPSDITAGCGQKGPLYLPETEEEKEEKSSG